MWCTLAVAGCGSSDARTLIDRGTHDRNPLQVDLEEVTAHGTAPTAGDAGVPPTPDAPVWSSAQRLAFRFIFAYLALFITTDAFTFIGVQLPPITALRRVVIPWVGAHVLGLTEPVAVSPTGD
jgi:hypothetical protein